MVGVLSSRSKSHHNEKSEFQPLMVGVLSSGQDVLARVAIIVSLSRRWLEFCRQDGMSPPAWKKSEFEPQMVGVLSSGWDVVASVEIIVSSSRRWLEFCRQDRMSPQA